MSEDLSALAAAAFGYGYPLVCDLTAVKNLLHSGLGSMPPQPFNVFGHATNLAGPDDEFVSINNDTVYSIANLDVSAGPIRLDLPDSGGRYYVMQFVDAWTNNFAYLGRRATGTAAGSYLLVPPGWRGSVPAGLTKIELPTMVATIVGRTACDGEVDLPNVEKFQRGLVLTPLDPDAPLSGLHECDPDVPDDLTFFEQMRTWMAAFPPSAADQEYQRRFEPLGLLEPGRSPFVDTPHRPALLAGMASAKAELEAYLTRDNADTVNGWVNDIHLFDYNVDRLALGTIDDPAWQLGDRGPRFQRRMAAARGGLWGNHGYEAAYPMVRVDGDGRQLNGAHSYTLRLEAHPPVHAFWSLTMYDTPNYYLVANPINRYSIGDRTPGLQHAEDGSLTIVMQRNAPTDPVELANWLPTPEGDFRPLLRLYQPDSVVLNGNYVLPPIIRRD